MLDIQYLLRANFLQPPACIQNTSQSWARDRQSVIAAKVRVEPGHRYLNRENQLETKTADNFTKMKGEEQLMN